MVPAYNGQEPYIFVSYAHKDSAEVYGTIEKLVSLGYRVWYDEGIKPGVEWPENIAVHLDKCALFMMFISPNSMASANCRREINFALSRGKKFLCIVLKKTEIPLGMELQLASQQSIFRYKYSSEKAFIYKVCSASGMSQCKDVHFYDGEGQKAAGSASALYGSGASPASGNRRAGNPGAVSGAARKRNGTAAGRKKKGAARTRNSGSGAGTVFLGLLLAAAIILGFVYYMIVTNGFGSGSASLNPTVSPAVSPTPSVTVTPAPTETPVPVETQQEEHVTEEQPAQDYDYTPDNNEWDTGYEDDRTAEGTEDYNNWTQWDDGNADDVPLYVPDEDPNN